MAEVNIPAELLAKERAGRTENREAIHSWDEWVAEHGLPLAEYRRF